MTDREKVIRGLELCLESIDSAGCPEECPYYEACQKYENFAVFQPLMRDALKVLKAQKPRVMTLEEVVAHYSLPPVFPDDLGMQFDYYEDIQPLYFDFPYPDDPWIIHWRGYDQVGRYLDQWKADYGKTWRCWTAKPTEEQRGAVKWE